MQAGLSKLILGTVQLGLDYGINNAAGKPTLNSALDILAYAQRHGINTLDTAEAYGNAIEVISTYHISNPPFNIINKFGSTVGLIETCLTSQERLGIDCYEAYLFHSFKNFMEEKANAAHLLKKLQNEDRVRKIGVSVYTNEEMETVINTPEVDVIQLPFNLLDNLNRRGDLLKKAKDKGKEIHTRSAFLQGLFFKEESSIPEKLQPLLPYLKVIKDISNKHGISVQSLALNYALSCPLVDKVLIGVDSLTQLEQNIQLANDTPEPVIFEAVNKIDVKEIELLNPVNWK